MKIKIKNTGTIVPKNLTQYDVGYDLVASSHPAISGEYNEEAQAWSRIDYIQYHTDLYIEPCVDDKVYHTNIFPRSSISNKNLMLANSIGLIDAGYRGEIMAAVDNRGDKDYMIVPGQRLFQIVHPTLCPFNVGVVDKLSKTDRGDGGFGSTGK